MTLLKFCDVETGFSRLKTGYICYLGGSVFDGIIKEKWCFVLGMIIGIIVPKTNKF